MNRYILSLPVAATAYSNVCCQDKTLSVTLTPLIGDTLYANSRSYFSLFTNIEGLQRAEFSTDSDTNVIAKVCIIKDGIQKYTSVRMGSLRSLRKELDGLQEERSRARRPRKHFFVAASLTELAARNDWGNTRRTLSARLELGYKISGWLTAGMAMDGYDQTRDLSINFLIVFCSPVDFSGIEPYAY